MPKLERFPSAARASAAVFKVARSVVKQRVSATLLYWKRVADRNQPREEDVHQLRVWSRRAIASVELFRSELAAEPAEELVRILNKLRKRAGKIRDIDVLLTSLDKSQRKQLVRTRNALKDRRARQSERVRRSYRKRLKSGDLPQLLKNALKPKDASEKLADKRASERRKASRNNGQHQTEFGGWFLREFATAAGSLRSKLRVAKLTEPQIHSLRIVAKQVRYALEIGLQVLPKEVGQTLYGELELIQQKLGEICDSLALAEQFRDLSQNEDDKTERKLLLAIADTHRRDAKTAIAALGPWWKSPAGRKKLLQLFDLARAPRRQRATR